VFGGGRAAAPFDGSADFAGGGVGVRGDGAGGTPGRGPTGGMLEKGGRFGDGTPRGGGGSAPVGRSVLLRPGCPSSDNVGMTFRIGTGGPTTGGGSDGTGSPGRVRLDGCTGGVAGASPRSSVSVPLGT
jgi:hypothetical protein